MRRWITVVMACLLHSGAKAAIEPWQFKDEAQEQQFMQLTNELRCPKCQNNSIADSNAKIAADMRKKAYQLMQEGQNRQQIIDYMVARYGNFVTYDPPLTPFTVLLWLLPGLFAFGGVVMIVRRSPKDGSDTRTPSALSAPKIPEHPRENRAPLSSAAIRRLWPGGTLLIVLVTGGMFLKTSSIFSVLEWQRTVQKTPALLQRVLQPGAEPLTHSELELLETGLRAQLQEHPDDKEGWGILGRLNLVLGRQFTAMQSFQKAWLLAPYDRQTRLDYADILNRSASLADNQQAEQLLRGLLSGDPDNPELLNSLALNATARQQYDEAISLWQTMLQKLSSSDNRRQLIEWRIAEVQGYSDSRHPSAVPAQLPAPSLR
ncbi:TPA: cytochrome c biogenesis protein CcmH [Enterobacter hormaechei subsp. steigerwaltii]|nr:cytochrome c biogenesis protein CcmH [Enterobacter hormaechei subsp. steigerwaltii]